MKRVQLYQRCEMASRMEAVLVFVAVMSAIGASAALLSVGLLPCLAFLILGSLAFGMARLFDLVGELLKATAESEDAPKSEPHDDSQN